MKTTMTETLNKVVREAMKDMQRLIMEPTMTDDYADREKKVRVATAQVRDLLGELPPGADTSAAFRLVRLAEREALWFFERLPTADRLVLATSKEEAQNLIKPAEVVMGSCLNSTMQFLHELELTVLLALESTQAARPAGEVPRLQVPPADPAAPATNVLPFRPPQG